MTSRIWRLSGNASGVAMFTMLGYLGWGGPGPANLAGAAEECAAADPEAGDYCQSDVCGPCFDGEGDCDPGQCEAGLTCMEEGDVDHCRPTPGKSNFQVLYNGAWRGICCEDGLPVLSKGGCAWSEYDRTLTDDVAGLELDCPEGDPTGCTCNWDGERMHGINGWELDASIKAPGGGPVYSDEGLATCVVVGADRVLETAWTDASCPNFRFR